MEQLPVAEVMEEYRITDKNGISLVLQIKNVPVVQTANKLAKALRTIKNHWFSSEIMESNLVEQLKDDIRKLRDEFDDLEAKVPDLKQENTEDLKVFIEINEKLEKLGKDLANKTQELEFEKLVVSIERGSTMPLIVIKEVLGIICPGTNVTDDLAECISFRIS